MESQRCKRNRSGTLVLAHNLKFSCSLIDSQGKFKPGKSLSYWKLLVSRTLPWWMWFEKKYSEPWRTHMQSWASHKLQNLERLHLHSSSAPRELSLVLLLSSLSITDTDMAETSNNLQLRQEIQYFWLCNLDLMVFSSLLVPSRLPASLSAFLSLKQIVTWWHHLSLENYPALEYSSKTNLLSLDKHCSFLITA